MYVCMYVRMQYGGEAMAQPIRRSDFHQDASSRISVQRGKQASTPFRVVLILVRQTLFFLFFIIVFLFSNSLE